MKDIKISLKKKETESENMGMNNMNFSQIKNKSQLSLEKDMKCKKKKKIVMNIKIGIFKLLVFEESIRNLLNLIIGSYKRTWVVFLGRRGET